MPRSLSFAAVSVLHALGSGAGYGFEVIDATGLPSGTVYPALGRLERDGLVRSSWEDATIAQDEKRPPRRYYKLTAPGVRLLNEQVVRYRALKPIPAKGRA